MTDFINLTPHDIKLNDGHTVKVSGTIARVSATYSSFDSLGICEQTFGRITAATEEHLLHRIGPGTRSRQGSRPYGLYSASHRTPRLREG